MKKCLILFSLVTFALSLAGCNTVSGFGKDMQSGGRSVTKAAQNVKN